MLPAWTMSAAVRRATLAFAEALFSDDGTPPNRQHLEWMADEMEDFLARAGGQARTVYVASLTTIDRLGPIRIGRLGPLCKLELAERQRAMEAIEHSPVGLTVFAVKALCCIAYYEHPAMEQEIGFDGQCLKSEPRTTAELRIVGGN